MLLHLGPAAKKKLLQLINDNWRTGTVPQTSKEAIMVPVHKKGKEKAKVDSYRPISLTSSMGKLKERLINTRLMWHLATKGLINPEQAAFRQDRFIENQITNLTRETKDAFQEKKHTPALWFDMGTAFDNVYKGGLKLKLRHCGAAERMYKWIDQYLRDRRDRVQI